MHKQGGKNVDTSTSEYQRYVEIGREVLRSLYGDDAAAYREVAFRVGKDMVDRFISDTDEARQDAIWRVIGSLRREVREEIEKAEKRSYAEKMPANSSLPEHDALVIRLWYTAGALLASRLKAVQSFREDVLRGEYLTPDDAKEIAYAIYAYTGEYDPFLLADEEERYSNLQKLLQHLNEASMSLWTLKDVVAFAKEKSAAEVDAYVENLLLDIAVSIDWSLHSISIAESVNRAVKAIESVTGWNELLACEWLLSNAIPEEYLREAQIRATPKYPFLLPRLNLPAGLSYATVIGVYRELTKSYKHSHRKPPSKGTLLLAIDVLERRIRGQDWKQIAAHYGRRPSYIKRDVIRALRAIEVMLKPEQL